MQRCALQRPLRISRKHLVMETPQIAILVRSFTGGGMERMLVTLAGGFARRGYRTSLWVGVPHGALRTGVPAGVEVVQLRRSLPLIGRLAAASVHPTMDRSMLSLFGATSPSMMSRLPDLARQMRERRPDVLFAAGTQSNVAALWARKLSGVDTRIVVSERNTLSVVTKEGRGGFRRAYHLWAGQFYPGADAIVSVSNGVADDLSRTTAIARECITVLPNPVVSPQLLAHASEPLQHPWLDDAAVPLLLAAGRLHRQKDFPTLLRAFARVRAERPVRLVILGEGSERRRLERLVQELRIAPDVALPGFSHNPWAWMSRAALFVLSSAWEGIANVLIEALACGCPVVSTDCPGGPREILSGGVGELTAIGDDRDLAAAILRSLGRTHDRAWLRSQAAGYSVERSLDRHLEVLLAPGRRGDSGQRAHHQQQHQHHQQQ